MKKILVVEDIELNIDLLTQLLEDDYALVVARDGAQAVALAEREHPDLILMDISLPIMDGYQATQQIRIHEAMREIPIIGLSASAMNSDVDKAFAAGFTDYMTKPLDENVLFDKLKRYLGKANS